MSLHVKVVLCDINPKMIKAWQETFSDNPEVEIAAVPFAE